MFELLIPEGTHKDFGALGNVDDFSNGPHQGAIHPHQFVVIDLIGLVQNNTYFILITMNSLNTPSELVRDVQFVSVKQ